MLSTTNLFLFLLLILPCSILADDSTSFKQPQDLTYPPIFSSSSSTPSDADPFQTVTNPDFSPDVLLLAGSENNLADCQSAPPTSSSSSSSRRRRIRRSRLRKRQSGFCNWQQFKSGGGPKAQTPQTATPPPVVPNTNTKEPADARNPGDEKAPGPIPFGGANDPGLCGPATETIPVCHYSPERLGSTRWLSPISVLKPVRLCKFFKFAAPPPLFVNK